MLAYVDPLTYSPILIGDTFELDGTETAGSSASGAIVMLIEVLSLTKVAPELFSLAIAEIVKETFPLRSLGALK